MFYPLPILSLGYLETCVSFSYLTSSLIEHKISKLVCHVKLLYFILHKKL